MGWGFEGFMIIQNNASMKFLIYSIVIVFSLFGCSNKDKFCTPKQDVIDNSKECSKTFYRGYLKFGINANIYKSTPSLLIFNIYDRECFATTYSEPIFQANRVRVMFDSMDCGFEKPLQVKGYILDKDCSDSVTAKHIVNNKTVKYLENRVKYFGGQDNYQEYIKAKVGWLETEPNYEVFVNIYEPSIFMFKDRLGIEKFKTIRGSKK